MQMEEKDKIPKFLKFSLQHSHQPKFAMTQIHLHCILETFGQCALCPQLGKVKFTIHHSVCEILLSRRLLESYFITFVVSFAKSIIFGSFEQFVRTLIQIKNRRGHKTDHCITSCKIGCLVEILLLYTTYCSRMVRQDLIKETFLFQNSNVLCSEIPSQRPSLDKRRKHLHFTPPPYYIY